ncbi:MFS transporter [Persicobacter psychrovividus]|uniref:Membrane protein n=1 Tax=Persicobacter psychrovividus TaxID=387638 RepID=A0ABM7VD83_9BACT|nr:membrane protein [Persicobacter psychrovividus]
MPQKAKAHLLWIIILSQFCCTSLWFAGNSVVADLIQHFHLPDGAMGLLTSSVQFGFVIGTLTFAVLTIVDRFSPSKVFLCSAIMAALANAGVLLPGHQLWSLMVLRFVVGFFLAGIYPVGMKIAADYYEQGLGKSLGYLVGALVIGTAFPHLLKNPAYALPWRMVMIITSALSLLGGAAIVLLVPDGPYRQASSKFRLTALREIFSNRPFRSAAFGYFGHMWELYTFWAFVPLMLLSYEKLHPQSEFNIPLWAFLIIAGGSIACVLGGYLSKQFGTKKTALIALTSSGACCLLSPLFFAQPSGGLFLIFLLAWGGLVIMDSPLFSTLVAQNTTAKLKGTALTIVNCIGYAITILSIQAVSLLKVVLPPSGLYMVLAAGPALGLWALLSGKAMPKK